MNIPLHNLFLKYIVLFNDGSANLAAVKVRAPVFNNDIHDPSHPANSPTAIASPTGSSGPPPTASTAAAVSGQKVLHTALIAAPVAIC